MTVTPTKDILKNSALNFLTGIVQAKETGQKLPPVLDKVASLAIKGKATGQTLAVEAAKEETRKQFPWIIVIVLVLVILLMFFNRK